MCDNNQELLCRPSPARLTVPKLLLVEGTHEVSFFNQLLHHMQISDIMVKSVGGKSEFRNHLRTLSKLDGFETLTALALVRDADDNFDAAFQSLQGSLRDASLPTPDYPMIAASNNNLQTLIFIAPNNQARGALEDLCLASIEDEAILSCVDSYMMCIEGIKGEVHPHSSKAKTQVYLAGQPTGDCSFARASEKDVWNWNSPAFAQIKEFLSCL